MNATGQTASICNPDGTCKPGVVSSDSQQLANQYCGMWHTFRDTIIVENNFQVRVRTHHDVALQPSSRRAAQRLWVAITGRMSMATISPSRTTGRPCTTVWRAC